LSKYPVPPDCPIPGAKGYCIPEGSGSLGVLALAEALGEHEEREGTPLVKWAPAGSVFERAIKRGGFARDQFVLYNAIPTHPPNNKISPAWEAAAINWGRQHVERVIHDYQPRCILALGNVPLKAVTGMAGEHRTISYMRGYVLPTSYGIPCVPSFHPSYLRRGKMSHFNVLKEDIQRAVRVAAGTDVNFELCPTMPLGYATHPSPAEAEAFADEAWCHPGLVAYDIETPRSGKIDDLTVEELAEKEILSIQFSISKGTGIFMPWREPYIGQAKRILATSTTKIGHNNWRFDDPLLKAHGCVIGGTIHDTRWMWHHLQPDLPANLQFIASFYGVRFPWKHLNDSNPEWYGIMDVDVLHYIYGG